MSIIELLVGSVILLLLLGILFQLLLSGVSMYQVGRTRTSAAQDLRKVTQALKADLRASSYYSLSSIPGPNVTVPLNLPGVSSQNAARDSLCMAALSDPGSAASYDPTSRLPMWDCYCIYYLSRDLPSGRLVRYLTPRGKSDNYAEVFSLFTQGSIYQGLTAPLQPGTGLKTLSHNIYSLSYDKIPNEQAIRCRVIILDEVSRIASGQRATTEFVESTFSIQCNNTWPSL